MKELKKIKIKKKILKKKRPKELIEAWQDEVTAQPNYLCSRGQWTNLHILITSFSLAENTDKIRISRNKT